MSSAQKRSSQGDGTDPASDKGTQLPKRTKLGPSAAGDEAVSLQRHLDEALDFINSQGLASKAPYTLQALLKARPSAAEDVAQQIKTRIYETWEPLCADTSGKQTGVHSSDISSAQCPHFPAIERLARLPNEHSLRLAYEVALYLKEHSYGDMDDDRGFGNRPSDEQGDNLLARLIRERRAAGETWDVKLDLDKIDREAQHMASYGVDSWYPETRGLLREVLRSASQASDENTENQPEQRNPVPSQDRLTKANLAIFDASDEGRKSKLSL
ncbi:hypothetical protein Daus18300_007067 [Diaporthe australafricana]|uniref:Uncharacterized protein n=1 Tax=Diaporthe australafricana TaxID=127596 RepID=A0ABR3WQL3_9PEZI